MTPERIAELRALVREGSPGKWKLKEIPLAHAGLVELLDEVERLRSEVVELREAAVFRDPPRERD